MGQTAPAVACGVFKKQVSRQSCLPVWRLSGAQLGALPGSVLFGEMGVR